MWKSPATHLNFTTIQSSSAALPTSNNPIEWSVSTCNRYLWNLHSTFHNGTTKTIVYVSVFACRRPVFVDSSMFRSKSEQIKKNVHHACNNRFTSTTTKAKDSRTATAICFQNETLRTVDSMYAKPFVSTERLRCDRDNALCTRAHTKTSKCAWTSRVRSQSVEWERRSRSDGDTIFQSNRFMLSRNNQEVHIVR